MCYLLWHLIKIKILLFQSKLYYILIHLLEGHFTTPDCLKYGMWNKLENEYTNLQVIYLHCLPSFTFTC